MQKATTATTLATPLSYKVLRWACMTALCIMAVLAVRVHAAPPAAPSARVLVLGDSISAEYGLPRGSGWVPLLQKRIDTAKKPWQVVNASISGDTTAGGRARLPQLLAQHRPQVVVIELGGNDALRGLPLQQTRDNLAAMIGMAQKAKARVLLVGMQVPPNYGADYAADFAAGFVQASKTHKVPLVPFLLKGVGDVADSQKWFQADRIHPNAQAQPLLLNNVWPLLEPLLN